ncbi:hypothetical protein MTO98_25905 [Mucilaginibacter sp. SMC90]|uniref:hypothetical protein n=1 Tax=Mucilaginibacter sp. SMC90 TaxID=2929803 RepID=UPI001FB4DE5E|nr:hypothetical protein [Mucilaginibacter sp. SMC90]UOE47849.1 hypothetical protein MTO98_25905 [Mucilaginibacter sp. SMC90]
MKKIRMAMMALAAVSGIGSAYAFNTPKKHFGTPYYGRIYSTGHFRWFTSAPAGCNTTALPNAACTITSTYDVTGAAYQDKLPAGANVQNDSDGQLRN